MQKTLRDHFGPCTEGAGIDTCVFLMDHDDDHVSIFLVIDFDQFYIGYCVLILCEN